MRTSLVGREFELQLVAGLIDGVLERGGALILSGEPGVGKSALLAAAAERADDYGMRVLRATGVQSETTLPFAGLHQLLQPILTGIDELADPQRTAILAAFGRVESPAPDLFLTALAALDLLSDAAANAPVLLIAEDAHWLDRSSADALGFIARRLEHEPILLIAAVRDGFSSRLDEPALPGLHLQPLDPAAAATLLDRDNPDLSPAVRQRVLEEASGNPLALVELPTTFCDIRAPARLPAWLPLTTRLQRAFASRASDMPATTRTALLVAAVNDGPSVSEVLAATSLLTGHTLTIEDLVPAVTARLAELDETEIAFRHPLMRAAIIQGASISQRHTAHAAIADVLIDQSERRVWHRAASVIGPDESIASELEAAAQRAQHRGASATAISALERAAELSDGTIHRGQRLLRAAELGFELGDRNLVSRLVSEAEPLELGSLERSHVSWLRGVFDGQQAGGADRLEHMVDAASELTQHGQSDLALKILWSAAIQCWWTDPGHRVRQRIVDAADRARADEHDPRLLAILALAAPLDRGAVVMDCLAVPIGPGSDADDARVVGTAANAIGAFDAAAPLLATAVSGLRTRGRLGLLARALTQQAWSCAQRVDLGVGIPVVQEAEHLAGETAQPTIQFTARAIQAMLAALRGDLITAEARAAEAEQFGITRGARALLAMIQHARGLAALADGRYANAFEHLQRIHNPSDPAFHSFMRCFSIADLVDAAARSGQTEAARVIVADMEAIATKTLAPVLQAQLRYARPLLASETDAQAMFATAASSDGLSPFLRARVHLAHGEWLRRHRREAAARPPLRVARETFDALGAIPWSDRARQQLRATGETSRPRTPDARDELTPQELQIAQMAAKGLTNREIGQMLYLSHRTISSHLYRTFPKLGITSRAELWGVLEPGIREPG
jgi:DNA-binding CsgD family transcriptional regulator